jgi:hypothetical protein
VDLANELHVQLLPNPSDTWRVEDFTDSHAAEIRDISKLLLSVDTQEFAGIHRAAQLFSDLRELHSSSTFIPLGLFAIIELLLTHNPGDKEIGDSLSHQIATKIPLVNNRLPTPIRGFRWNG